jgi:hypothetical protein
VVFDTNFRVHKEREHKICNVVNKNIYRTILIKKIHSKKICPTNLCWF